MGIREHSHGNVAYVVTYFQILVLLFIARLLFKYLLGETRIKFLIIARINNE